MAISMFDQFKQTLKLALQDTDFRRKNSVYQDDTFLQNALARVDALTSDVTISQDYSDVTSVLGMMKQDTANGVVRFDTRGFAITLSAFREGIVQSPSKFWRRSGDVEERYLLADRLEGILILNQEVNLLHRFPGFGDDLVSGQYKDSSACCCFTINDIEYIAITMQSHHVCGIYLYDAPNTQVALIGEIDVAGHDDTKLNTPVGIAVDGANERLYIVCLEGQPATATDDLGYIVAYDISDPTHPAFVEHVAFFKETGSLLDVEVNSPNDIFFENDLLWVTNGNAEVGAISTVGGNYRCKKYIEPVGAGYALNGPQQIVVHEGMGGIKRIYVANGAAGLIEEFDYHVLKHLTSYGYRALEDELNTMNRMSSAVYGAVAFAQGIMVDNVTLDNEETEVLICADSLNRRIHRFNLNTYSEDNFVNFGPLQFNVPVVLTGWSASGTIPPDMIKVSYRFAQTEDFRELGQSVTTPPTTKVQFRVAVKLDSRRFVQDWFIKQLSIHGKQA